VGVAAVARTVWRRRAELEAGPTVRSARDRQDRNGPAERGDEAGREDVLELGRRPPRLVRTRSAPLEQEDEPEPIRRMSRPVEDGQDRQAARANPAAAASAGPAQGAQAVADVSDDGAAIARNALGRPPDERAAGPRGRTACRDPEQVAGQDRGDERAARPRGAAGGSARSGDATRATTRPRIAVRAFLAEPATTAPTMTASATPARAGFTLGGSWRRRRQLRVGGRPEDPEDVDRPVAQPRATDDLRGLDGPNVRESDEFARWSPIRKTSPDGMTHWCSSPGTVVGWAGSPGSGAYRIPLVDLGAVDEDAPVVDVDGVAAETDDALDETACRPRATSRAGE
jgi:hypothetical protein